MENFNINISNDNLKSRVDTYLAIVKGNELNCAQLNILKDLVVNGNLTVKKGSNFSGGRHYFTDEKNAGKLRVGSAWNIPGIYAESNKDLAMDASAGNILTNVYMKSDLYIKNKFLTARH